jgi:uncharacterized protein (DUF697 family)
VRAVAQRLGEDGIALAARAPMLRRAVCEQLISEASRRNGLLGTAVFLPGQDLPVLTLHQLRLVLGLAAAHGLEIDAQRVPEAVIVVGGGIGFRALARRLLAVVPVAGWAVKGGLAYGGTRALGEAALRLYEARVADGASAQPERGPG